MASRKQNMYEDISYPFQMAIPLDNTWQLHEYFAFITPFSACLVYTVHLDLLFQIQSRIKVLNVLHEKTVNSRSVHCCWCGTKFFILFIYIKWLWIACKISVSLAHSIRTVFDSINFSCAAPRVCIAIPIILELNLQLVHFVIIWKLITLASNFNYHLATCSQLWFEFRTRLMCASSKLLHYVRLQRLDLYKINSINVATELWSSRTANRVIDFISLDVNRLRWVLGSKPKLNTV